MLRVIDDDQLDQLDQFGCVIQSYLHIQVIFGSSSSKAIGPGMYETNSYRRWEYKSIYIYYIYIYMTQLRLDNYFWPIFLFLSYIPGALRGSASWPHDPTRHSKPHRPSRPWEAPDIAGSSTCCGSSRAEESHIGRIWIWVSDGSVTISKSLVFVLLEVNSCPWMAYYGILW